MQLDPDVSKDITTRLRRARGQIDGIINMIEDQRPCNDIVTQVAAVSKALDRAGFKIVAAGLKGCLLQGGSDEMTQEELEKLFLSLA